MPNSHVIQTALLFVPDRASALIETMGIIWEDYPRGLPKNATIWAKDFGGFCFEAFKDEAEHKALLDKPHSIWVFPDGSGALLADDGSRVTAITKDSGEFKPKD